MNFPSFTFPLFCPYGSQKKMRWVLGSYLSNIFYICQKLNKKRFFPTYQVKPGIGPMIDINSFNVHLRMEMFQKGD